MENTKQELRWRRRQRVRAKISGTSSRPRLSVFRSNRSLYVQIIDDQKGKTLLTRQAKGKNKAAARALGLEIAQVAKKRGVVAVVFDRGGYRYHGTIQEIAEGAREGGLQL